MTQKTYIPWKTRYRDQLEDSVVFELELALKTGNKSVFIPPKFKICSFLPICVIPLKFDNPARPIINVHSFQHSPCCWSPKNAKFTVARINLSDLSLVKNPNLTVIDFVVFKHTHTHTCTKRIYPEYTAYKVALLSRLFSIL